MKIYLDLSPFNVEKTDSISLHTLNTILSYIIFIYYTSKYETFELSSRKLKNIHKKYKIYLDYLMEKGILIKSTNYWNGPGGYCNRFQLTDNFKNTANIIDIKIDEIKVEYDEDSRPDFINKLVADQLFRDYRKLEIDVILKKQNKTNKLYLPREDLTIVDFKKYIKNSITFYSIINGADKFYWKKNRLYTNFTYLNSKDKIDLTSFNDEAICCLDISSSFALFLSVYLKDKPVNIDEYNELFKGLKTKEFYDNLQEKLNFSGRKGSLIGGRYVRNYSREDAKIVFQIWINSLHNFNLNGSCRNDDINLVMNKHFPTIHRFLYSIKESKDTLYLILSEMEADFIFNQVCSRLYDEIKNIQIITCHDAIYFNKKYKKEVSEIWFELIDELYEKSGEGSR